MSDAAIALEAVSEGRALAEELMIDSCTIRRRAGVGTFGGGSFSPPAESVVYTGPCQVQVLDSLNAQDPVAGDQVVTKLRTIVKIPVTSSGIRVDDVVTVDAVGAGSDPELVDKTFRVEATHTKTYATARRLQCEETAP